VGEKMTVIITGLFLSKGKSFCAGED